MTPTPPGAPPRRAAPLGARRGGQPVTGLPWNPVVYSAGGHGLAAPSNVTHTELGVGREQSDRPAFGQTGRAPRTGAGQKAAAAAVSR